MEEANAGIPSSRSITIRILNSTTLWERQGQTEGIYLHSDGACEAIWKGITRSQKNPNTRRPETMRSCRSSFSTSDKQRVQALPKWTSIPPPPPDMCNRHAERSSGSKSPGYYFQMPCSNTSCSSGWDQPNSGSGAYTAQSEYTPEYRVHIESCMTEANMTSQMSELSTSSGRMPVRLNSSVHGSSITNQ